MQVTKTVEETRKQIKAWKKEGKTVGLVLSSFPVLEPVFFIDSR